MQKLPYLAERRVYWNKEEFLPSPALLGPQKLNLFSEWIPVKTCIFLC